MYVYVYVQAHLNTCTYRVKMFTYTNVYIHTYMSVYIHTHTHTYIHTFMNVYIHTHTLPTQEINDDIQSNYCEIHTCIHTYTLYLGIQR